MDTSRSADAGHGWSAGARLFSGRPDPVWSLTQAQFERLLVLWDGLRPTSRGELVVPALGYRGCFVADGAEREWWAYGGKVVCSRNAAIEARDDPGRAFEHAITATAPAGSLPPDLFE